MKKVAIYARVSTDRNQTVENQLVALQGVGERLGWVVVAVHVDEGISGAKGREQRPGFDALLKGVARREFDLIAAWSVDRLGRSLQDLVGFLADIQARGIDLYLHRQGLDTSTPSGRMMFQMLGVFAEFETNLRKERQLEGIQQAKAKGVYKGRKPKLDRSAVQALKAEGLGGSEIARRLRIGRTSVYRLLKAG